VPGIFTESLQFFSPDEIGNEYRLDGKKMLCNVGSVGQPRDGDWRACYVLLDGDVIRFRRVEYDINGLLAKVTSNPDLGSWPWEDLRPRS
jgi:diadenosine tetraphosphatase ApaH/serine/threonine PP2A family protein phosphatase